MKYLIKLNGLCALTMILLQSTSAFAEMTLESDDITDGAKLPLLHVSDDFGCEGQNISPHLKWAGAPEGTKSFIVTLFDPDAPTASGWWHWSVFNLRKDVSEMPARIGNKPQAGIANMVQVRNDFGFSEYAGACPPVGAKPHRYIFIVFAMPMERLPIDQSASPALVSYFAENFSLDSAQLTVTYGR